MAIIQDLRLGQKVQPESYAAREQYKREGLTDGIVTSIDSAGFITVKFSNGKEHRVKGSAWTNRLDEFTWSEIDFL